MKYQQIQALTIIINKKSTKLNSSETAIYIKPQNLIPLKINKTTVFHLLSSSLQARLGV